MKTNLKFFTPIALLSSLAMSLPAQADSLTKAMCLENDQQHLKDSIAAIVKDAQTRKLLPALAYDGYNIDRMTISQRANLKAEEESKKLSAALFAAIAQPETPAQLAAGVVTNNPSKLSIYSLKERCPALRGQPVASAECHGDSGGSMTAFTHEPIDMGINVSQVYETQTNSMQVIQAFMKEKLTSTSANTVSVCSGPLETCRQSPGFYFDQNAQKIVKKDIEIGREYYVQDKTTVGRFGLLTAEMTNRSALKVTEITNVCGGSVYLVSAFNTGGESGFDHASLLTVVASVGSKTLVVADFSAQASDLTSGGGDGYPLKFPANEATVNDMIIKGYDGIAQMIGATDRLDSYRIPNPSRIPAGQIARSSVLH